MAQRLGGALSESTRQVTPRRTSSAISFAMNVSDSFGNVFTT
jgi:hypothetical protein